MRFAQMLGMRRFERWVTPLNPNLSPEGAGKIFSKEVYSTEIALSLIVFFTFFLLML